MNYRQLKQTASRGTHELTTSALRPSGPHRAGCSTGVETLVGQPTASIAATILWPDYISFAVSRPALSALPNAPVRLTTQQVLPSTRFGAGTSYLFSCQRAHPTREKLSIMPNRVKSIFPMIPRRFIDKIYRRLAQAQGRYAPIAQAGLHSLAA